VNDNAIYLSSTITSESQEEFLMLVSISRFASQVATTAPLEGIRFIVES